MVSKEKFKLSDEFVSGYENKKAPFGFNGLGELTYIRTYSRIKNEETQENENWNDIVERVVNGTYSIQKRWIKSNSLRWKEAKAKESAQIMFSKIFNMKFMPPGRGLWSVGSPIIEERGLGAAANNCGFTSTKNISEEGSKPFAFLMDMSMLGVGIGFDTKGAGTLTIVGVNNDTEYFQIPDTREGWVDSLSMLVDAYFFGKNKPEFDYSLIRAEGEPIKGFGGVSSGPGPLLEMHEKIGEILSANTGKLISTTVIVDIMNLIGKAVVAGNVRRTAEIVFGDPSSDEFLDLKNYEVNPHRSDYGWTSNNSIFAEVGMDYSNVADRIQINGEPGLAWLQNMKDFGRMIDPPNYKDEEAEGGNPCLEQTLFDKELCTLVENFINNHETLEEFLETIKYSYLYAKTITLVKTHWEETNEVMQRNRRIGCSISGVAQFIAKHGIEVLRQWLMAAYDELERLDKVYSDWFGIPRSIKMTSNKPSGTVSLVAGAWPGIHHLESRFHIRRMRLSKHSKLIKPLKKAGYNLEPCVGSEDSTVVVEVPVDAGEGIRCLREVSMWEQLAIAAFMQRYWADNQVSVTITFDPVTEGHQIKHALNYYQYQLKGVSFLPRLEHGAYPQMPYEEITEEKYNEMYAKLKPLNFKEISGEEANVEKYCSNDSCQI